MINFARFLFSTLALILSVYLIYLILFGNVKKLGLKPVELLNLKVKRMLNCSCTMWIGGRYMMSLFSYLHRLI